MNHHIQKNSGWIEVICGSMFSGKTEELIRRLRRAKIAKQSVGIFKLRIDSRFSPNHIVSHSQLSIASEILQSTEEIIEKSKGKEVIGIDEVQFFGNSLVKICRDLANQNKRVIVSGLDKDFRGKPFDPIPNLLAEAEYITKTLAICVKCGNPAGFSHRLSNDKNQILIGDKDNYEARCRKCFFPPKD
tara:strand:+ start:22315 stop:22878 length:564 start_codon:yes stop_codon:yes gene_type:complete